jgi:hypothetical protein
MEPYEIVDELANQWPTDIVSQDDLGVLRFAVRTAFEFGALITRIDDLDDAMPTVERVATEISQALAVHYGMRALAQDCLSTEAEEISEEVTYVNETIVSGGELVPRLRRIAAEIVGDAIPMPLQWQVYRSVFELKREYLEHLETLQSAHSNAQQRIYALLNTTRLQMTFLANTFC